MDEALKDKVKTGVLLEQGQKISDEDPIFSYLIGQMIVLENFTQPIVDAMRALPGELENSISKIVFAVEEVERTSEILLLETKGALSALAKVEVESAHERLKRTIENDVAHLLKGALQRVNDDITQVERQAKTLNKGLRESKTSMLNMVLAVAVVGLICLFSTASYLLYEAGLSNRDAANYWHDQYKSQQNDLKSLPLSLKKQLPNKLLIE